MSKKKISIIKGKLLKQKLDISVPKVAFLIIGTLIGAGFASGREIYLFFNIYGINGIIGIAISSILTGIIIKKVLKKNRSQGYYKLLQEQNKKYPKINKIIIAIVNLFLLISYIIMIAGFSAFLKQIYGVNTYLSSIIFTAVCMVIFLKNIEGVLNANAILVPIIILLISYLGIKNIPYLTQIIQRTMLQTVSNIEKKGWFIKAILYTSYNSIILIPVLSNLKKHKINSNKINKITIICIIFIIILSLSIYSLILRGINYAQEIELPMLIITEEFGTVYKYIYGIVIVISIFTSAISTGYSFLQNVSKSRKQYIYYLLIINIIGIIASNIGFSNLVNTLYPIFGILGMIQIILILK